MKNLPKPEAGKSRKEAMSGNQANWSSGFAVVLFMRADSHEAIWSWRLVSRALRARSEAMPQDAVWRRLVSAQVFRLQGRVSGVLFHGDRVPASRESRFAEDNEENRFFSHPAVTPGHQLPPAGIRRAAQAAGPAGIRRTRGNALGAGLGARTLADNTAALGCVIREKRLTAERAA